MTSSSRLLGLVVLACLAVACGGQAQQAAGPASDAGTAAPVPSLSPAPPAPAPSASGPARPAPPATTPAAHSGSAVICGHVLGGPVRPVSQPGLPDSPVSGALVRALQGTNIVATARSDSAGYYQLALPPGTYVISVSYSGFRQQVPAARTVVAAGGQTRTQDFTLATGMRLPVGPAT